jgi:hypothetical protein
MHAPIISIFSSGFIPGIEKPERFQPGRLRKLMDRICSSKESAVLRRLFQLPNHPITQSPMTPARQESVTA